MAKKKTTSAGILGYHLSGGELRVLVGHPGGPYFARRDEGVWTIPKGEVNEHEETREAAVREFLEEVGWKPEGPFIPLGFVKQKSGKVVHAWAAEISEEKGIQPISSQRVEIEWPPKSGKMKSFPEIDQIKWMSTTEARAKLIEAQFAFVERLAARLEKQISA